MRVRGLRLSSPLNMLDMLAGWHVASLERFSCINNALMMEESGRARKI
jgi:hypothetical protein